MTPKRDERRAGGCRVDARLELLDMACDDIKEAIYHNSLYGNEFDILAVLVTIYCRRALAIGKDPQYALEEYWPTMRHGFRATGPTTTRWRPTLVLQAGLPSILRMAHR